eukprot:scaffold955_cov79-Skeletonema_dohrnii-CCMP3373.AAC.4
MDTSLDNNKLNIDTSTGSDDIPFILCALTKNEDDGTAQSQDTTTDNEESSELITFSLKPRRSCHSLWHNEDVEQIAISDMLSESFLNDIQKDSANKTMESNSLHLSPRSSPLPTFRSIDVMITPPPAPRPQMLYLLKPRDSQEVHRRGRHDDTSPSVVTGPPFPILERRDDHRHLWQQLISAQNSVVLYPSLPQRTMIRNAHFANFSHLLLSNGQCQSVVEYWLAAE